VNDNEKIRKNIIQEEKTMNRKGLALGDLPTLAIVFVVAFGTKIIVDVGTGLTGEAAKVTGNATAGAVNLASYAPTIGTVLAGAVVIGILISAFMRK
jgi:hypothetical protein